MLAKAQYFVDCKYVARADGRQKLMGLAYVEAERQDLAREIVNFAMSCMAAQPSLPAQGAPGWRCFHCDETFTDEAAAKDHFGYDMLAEPGCKLNELEGGLLGILRRQEEQLSAYHREETASYREFYSLGADHARALRREEEKGYARGVADCRSETLASTVLSPPPQPDLCHGGVDPGWDECPKCGATMDDPCAHAPAGRETEAT